MCPGLLEYSPLHILILHPQEDFPAYISIKCYCKPVQCSKQLPSEPKIVTLTSPFQGWPRRNHTTTAHNCHKQVLLVCSSTCRLLGDMYKVSDSYHMTNLIHQGTDGLTLDCACLVSRPPPFLFFDLRSHGSRRVVKTGKACKHLSCGHKVDVEWRDPTAKTMHWIISSSTLPQFRFKFSLY